jgi:hypothetical protein
MKNKSDLTMESRSNNMQAKTPKSKSIYFVAKLIRFTLHNLKNILAFIFISKMRLK